MGEYGAGSDVEGQSGRQGRRYHIMVEARKQYVRWKAAASIGVSPTLN